MQAENYLENRLKNCSKYELSQFDNEYIKKNGLKDFIFNKIMSKKYRKWSVDEDTISSVKKAIEINIKNNFPIKFIYPFGGYKLWRLPLEPEVDWAEFFAIAYYLEYISSIAAAYETGVELRFSSDDIIIERMNNIPKEDTDRYFNSFKKLLGNFQKYLPNNIKIDIVRVADLYDKDDFEIKLEENIKKLSNVFDKNKLKNKLVSSELNIKKDGKEDWSNLNQKEIDKTIEKGAIYHDAYCQLVDRRSSIRREDAVVLFTTRIEKGIPIGTTKNSITKFWTGYGILECVGDRFYDRILSPKQLDSLSDNLEEENINLINLVNFKSIKIINKKIDFVNK